MTRTIIDLKTKRGEKTRPTEFIAEFVKASPRQVPAKKDLLWVFDTQQYLEIFAPTREEAEAKAAKVEEETGLDFVLEYDWEIRQEEHSDKTS